jgi:hypothetical protein
LPSWLRIPRENFLLREIEIEIVGKPARVYSTLIRAIKSISFAENLL